MPTVLSTVSACVIDAVMDALRHEAAVIKNALNLVFRDI